ncbi:MAG: hypothetical protein LUG89_05925 [Methanosphaera sp.]|nr:hypothetical protein [Methanosphaera sp.]
MGIAVMLEFIFRDLLTAIIPTYGDIITFLIEFVWWMYVLYDTMACTDAINDHRRAPKFFGIKLY